MSRSGASVTLYGRRAHACRLYSACCWAAGTVISLLCMVVLGAGTGHLCQMGLKEGFITAVKNITSVILTFISNADEEGVPWGVQLASVYMLCDTAACDPALIHQTLQAWKETTENVPPAVITCMQEVASLCAQDK